MPSRPRIGRRDPTIEKRRVREFRSAPIAGFEVKAPVLGCPLGVDDDLHGLGRPGRKVALQGDQALLASGVIGKARRAGRSELEVE